MKKTPPKEDGLLAKWQMVTHALFNKLPAGDCAVLAYVLERYNATAGTAWPGFTNIATNTRLDRKTVIRSIQRLEAQKYIQIIERGGRPHAGVPGRSNRYRPNWGIGAPTPLSDEAIGASTPVDRGVHAPLVGAPTPPDTTHDTDYKIGGNGGVAIDKSMAGPAGAAPLGGLPPGAAQGKASDRKYEVFWQAYPRKPGARTGPVEDQIDAWLGKGESLDAIVAGAQAYAKLLLAKPFHDPKYTRDPKKWLAERGWLDDYRIEPKPPKADKGEKPSKAGKGGETAKYWDANNWKNAEYDHKFYKRNEPERRSNWRMSLPWPTEWIEKPQCPDIPLPNGKHIVECVSKEGHLGHVMHGPVGKEPPQEGDTKDDPPIDWDEGAYIVERWLFRRVCLNDEWELYEEFEVWLYENHDDPEALGQELLSSRAFEGRFHLKVKNHQAVSIEPIYG